MTDIDVAEVDARFTHVPPYDARDEADHETVRQGARRLARELATVLPEGREKSLAITAVEEAVFWANRSLARSRLPARGPGLGARS